MKKYERLRLQILEVTASADGLETVGKQLASSTPEYAAHLRNGAKLTEIGSSWVDEQMRWLFAYTLDKELWETLVRRCSKHIESHTQTGTIETLFSPWSDIDAVLDEFVGERFGWKPGYNVDLTHTTFAERLYMLEAQAALMSQSDIDKLEFALGQEETEGQPKAGGCYIATAVYGSYEAPEVRVLRRWRDDSLSSTAWGRSFIRAYYAFSPRLVRVVGGRSWFNVPTRQILDRWVKLLRSRGFSSDGSSNSFF